MTTATIKRPHLFVSTLTGGGRHWEAQDRCFDQLKVECEKAGISLTMSRNGGTGVDRARCQELAVARDHGFDAFLQVDDDVLFDPRDVVKMFQTNLPVICAAYPRKQIEWEQVANAVKRGVPVDQLALHASSFVFNHLLGGGRVFEHLDGFTVCEAGELPTGMLMVRREAAEKFIEHWREDIEFVTDYQPRGQIQHLVFLCQRDPRSAREMASRAMRRAAKEDNPEALLRAAQEYRGTIGDPTAIGRLLTEDYAFTVMWRLMGEKAWLAIDVRLVHLGQYAYRGDIRHALGLKLWDDKAVKQGRRAQKLRVMPPEDAGRQSVLDGSYDIPGLEFATAPSVLDIGANIGAFSVFIAGRYPGAQTTAYEPSPRNASLLRQNVEGLPVTVVEAAVVGTEGHGKASADGTLPLFRGKNNPGEASIYKLGEQTADFDRVDALFAGRLPSCDILKIDTEGCEVEILESYPHLGMVRALMLEWHRPEDYKLLLEWLPTLGFALVRDDTGGKWARDRNLIFMRKEAAMPAKKEGSAVLPDATEVLPGLFFGSRAADGPSVRDAGFRMVVSCTPDQPGSYGHEVEVIRLPLLDECKMVPDGPNGQDVGSTPIGDEVIAAIKEAGRMVAGAVQDKKGVLVTCQQGRNRSAVVVAYAVHLLTGKKGPEIIADLRAKRPLSGTPPVLCNKQFHGFISSL